MRTARYFVINERDLGEWNEFNTQGKALKAVEEIANDGAKRVVVKVIAPPKVKELAV